MSSVFISRQQDGMYNCKVGFFFTLPGLVFRFTDVIIRYFIASNFCLIYSYWKFCWTFGDCERKASLTNLIFSLQNMLMIRKRNEMCNVYTLCIRTNKMHKILVIRLYFLLDALHVSDYVSPSSGATFISCTSHLV